MLGYFVGYFFTGERPARSLFIPLSVAVTGVLAAGAYYSGDSLVLGASRAHEVNEADAPELVHVVRELSLAANVPSRASTSSTTPRPTRSRPVVTRSTPRSR